ncbi:MAG TPA: hypothetical protein VHR45_15935 [Thermoanaerobaculia bacterium]|nr:hypothetical protein [Thermoanaerobaculia bacterium]
MPQQDSAVFQVAGPASQHLEGQEIGDARHRDRHSREHHEVLGSRNDLVLDARGGEEKVNGRTVLVL